MATDIQICNLALLKFGDVTVTSITVPTTKEERACAVLYPIVRDLMLYSHPWNFAMARANITASVTTAPIFPENHYAYTLPTDCLRVWELYGSTAKWVSEGGTLITSQNADIYIRYIKQVTTTSLFNPAFVNCLATRLAADLAAKLSGDLKKRQSLLQELINIELPNAYQLNAIEGNRDLNDGEKPLDLGALSWQTEGHSSLTDEVFST